MAQRSLVARALTTPPYRRLRVFAFDPLLSTQLDTRSINQLTLNVAWEDQLAPGPVGEYLEVVDFDLEQQTLYEAVDLNHPHLLATDGLAPSEGNMQFHQQMVYAVAMTTIRQFERALGRKALWAPQSHTASISGQSEFVRRLRVYPHGLPGEANAFYSPDKKALFFGYFRASAQNPGRNLPNGMVYTCLSHDVIAHETTHALLDGMHERFIEPSNPDVLAFHEAFADIVAIFQHFTFPQVLQHQISQTRGNLSDQNLLAQLAVQFGEGIGTGGALRDSLGGYDEASQTWKARRIDANAMAHTFEPHARGAILVAAVFDAFLAIYNRRSSDLLRIATGGSGILPAGDLHPDLVNRLADEAGKSAQHVLTMCIRALDYCPPVDITFGEYLRALITADTELVHDDDLGYRLAVTDAFRRRGIYPLHVSSLAPDSLVWQRADDQSDGFICGRLMEKDSRALLDKVNQWNLSASREQVFEDTRELRGFLHRVYAKLRETDGLASFEAATGLALGANAPRSILRARDGLPLFEIHAVRPSRRVGPDGQLLMSLIVEIMQKRYVFVDPDLQERADSGELSDSELKSSDFVFRGGCTLIYDLETAQLRYSIRKNIISQERLDAQRAFFEAPDQFGHLAAQLGHEKCKEPFRFLHGRREL